MRKLSSMSWVLKAVSLVAVLGLAACGGSSGNSDEPGGGCTKHEDCFTTNSNWTCNTLTKTCVDHGLCTTDTECAHYYTDGLPYCGSDGLCAAEQSTVDGDGTSGEGDNETVTGTCKDFSGSYDGKYVCGDGTTTKDTYVFVNTHANDCSFLLTTSDLTVEGKVSEASITTTTGKSCSGSGSIGGPINLTCQDGCTITLTEKSASACQSSTAYLDQSILDFGAIQVNQPVTKTIKITNSGTTDLKVIAIRFSQDTPSVFTFANSADWTFPTTIASGASKNISVQLLLDTLQAQTGQLILITDECNQPIRSIPLTSAVKDVPNLISLSEVLAFGSQPPGEGPTFDNIDYFLVKNTGQAVGTIESVTLTDDGGGNFALYKVGDVPLAGVTYPVSVAAGVQLPIYINFHPKTTAPQGSTLTGNVRVTWYDANMVEQHIDVQLLGKVAILQPPCLSIDPLEGTTTIVGSTVAGPGIQFGYSSIDEPTYRELTFKNCGDQDLVINAPVMTGYFPNQLMGGPAVNPFSAPDGFHQMTLRRGEQSIVRIAYRPLTTGQQVTATVGVTSNAQKVSWNASWAPASGATTSTISIGLTGTGAKRELSVLPSKIDFGLVTLQCCSRPETVSVYNLGELPLKITNVTIGSGSDNYFDLLNTPTMPYTLGGSGNPQSISTDVRFCPSHEGAHTGRIEIYQDGTTAAAFIVPLTGQGTRLTHQTDTWTQATRPMIDVLWVIDNSGSMAEEQDRLATNFETFINQATQWTADLQVAVTTTDIDSASQSGNFQGTPKIIQFGGTSGMSRTDAITAFKNTVKVGTNGSSTEQGLEAAHLALSAPLINAGNAGFIREDAKLSIIFVSDEEDHSESDYLFYIDFFRNIKGVRNTSMLEVYAIVGDSGNGCTDNSSGSGEDAQTAEAGERYIKVADACNPHANEHFMSICKTDYSSIYTTMAENLFALRNQFFLSRVADPATIKVTINGTATTDWTYDDVTNSVVFPEDNPPPAGATIVVDYETLCLTRN